MHDVIIVGGSYAGLSAALQLGRARRRVLVFDAMQPRNRFVRVAHGFLGHDGESPDAIRERARANVLAYDTVEIRFERVTTLAGTRDAFRVVTDQGDYQARRLVLATGVIDELPPIPGLRERWGATVFHCPYCDGYERQCGRIGVIATSSSLHHVVLVSHWAGPNQTRFFLQGVFEPSDEEHAKLARHGITVERRRVTQISGGPTTTDAHGGGGNGFSVDVHVDDGEPFTFEGVFLLPATRIDDRFAQQLGCELAQTPTGPRYKTDHAKQTTARGVYACGDAALEGGYIAYAVADGTLAGAFVHQSLVFQ